MEKMGEDQDRGRWWKDGVEVMAWFTKKVKGISRREKSEDKMKII